MRREDLPTNADWTLGDWDQVLPTLPDGEYWSSSYSGAYSVYDGGKVDDITADRIERVALWFGDSPEGGGSLDFAAVVKLTDRSWAACLAWADYTGWGCRDGVQWKWARTRADVIAQGLDRPTRQRLGVSLPTEVEGGVR